MSETQAALDQAVATLESAIDLISLMLDEILALHEHANEPLPYKLLQAKRRFDRQMMDLLSLPVIQQREKSRQQ